VDRITSPSPQGKSAKPHLSFRDVSDQPYPARDLRVQGGFGRAQQVCTILWADAGHILRQNVCFHSCIEFPLTEMPDCWTQAGSQLRTSVMGLVVGSALVAVSTVAEMPPDAATIRQLSLRRSSLCTRWPLQCTKQTGFAFLEERDRAHCKALTPNCFSIAFFTMHFDVEEFARELNLLCFVLDCPYRGSTRSFASPPASMPLSATPFTDGDTEAQRDPRQTGSDFYDVSLLVTEALRTQQSKRPLQATMSTTSKKCWPTWRYQKVVGAPDKRSLLFRHYRLVAWQCDKPTGAGRKPPPPSHRQSKLVGAG